MPGVGSLRIVHVYDGHEAVLPGEGSVPTVVYNLAKSCAMLGHDVTVLERRQSSGQEASEYRDGIRFLRIGSRPLAGVPYSEVRSFPGIARLAVDRAILAARFARALRREEFDIVHVHLPFAANLLVLLDPRVRRRLVYTAHLGEVELRLGLGKSRRLLGIVSPDLFLMRRAARIVVLNKDVKRMVSSGGRIKNIGDILVVPNGVEEVPNAASEQDTVESRGGVLTVLSVGTITPRKGGEALVEAADMVVNEGGRRDVLFVLAGNRDLDRPYAERIMSLVRTLALGGNVVLPGYLDRQELSRLLSVCDIFVSASFQEGDPVALKEALARGKSLVGTRIGGIVPQIIDGWNGFLAEPGDSTGLAAAITHLLENPGERRVMGRRSHKLASTFRWERIGKRYVTIYQGVVG